MLQERHLCEITWLRSSSISLSRYDSKIRKVSRCRPAISNETVLATRQEFFFTKVAPVQSITDIVILDFWLLSWIFDSSNTSICFFVTTFIFSNIYISVSLRVFCLKKGTSIKYVRNWWGDSGSSKMRKSTFRGRGFDVCCVRTYVHYLFSCF